MAMDIVRAMPADTRRFRVAYVPYANGARVAYSLVNVVDRQLLLMMMQVGCFVM